jgi:hypothetical protein
MREMAMLSVFAFTPISTFKLGDRFSWNCLTVTALDATSTACTCI